MPKLLNLGLMAHPYNWVIVFLMCVFALIGLSLLFPEATPEA